MTAKRSFKRLVRARMVKTGESYTAARAVLLAATDGPDGGDAPMLATSEETIRDRTGRGWEEWFDLLDDAVADKSHREIARWLADVLGLHPLAWNVQAVTGSYERARRGRATGEHADGFSVSASKTIAVPVDKLFEAFVDPDSRESWIPGVTLTERKTTPPRTAHFDWADGRSRIHLTFAAKEPTKSVVTVEHARLPDAEQAGEMKQWWRERLSELKATLEGGAR